MNKLLIILSMLSLSVNAEAAIKTKIVEYKQGDTILEGYMAWDDSSRAKRPGILVVHEWTGLNNHMKQRAEMLAKLGYVALAADIYGKGIRPATPAEAGKTAGIYKNDIQLMRARARAGLEELKKQKFVDLQRTAAIGYCFGGTTVLELARDAADIRGVISFHGGLSTPNPQDAKNIKAKVLAMHGADDPFVKPEEVAAFQDEMRKGGVDWQFISYSNAVHSFTNKEAGTEHGKERCNTQN